MNKKIIWQGEQGEIDKVRGGGGFGAGEMVVNSVALAHSNQMLNIYIFNSQFLVYKTILLENMSSDAIFFVLFVGHLQTM